VPPHRSNKKANSHACIETEAELSKLNGILIAGERHCIKCINIYPWLVVKGSLKGYEYQHSIIPEDESTSELTEQSQLWV